MSLPSLLLQCHLLWEILQTVSATTLHSAARLQSEPDGVICLHIFSLSLASKLLQGVVLPHGNVYTLPNTVVLKWHIWALKVLCIKAMTTV